MDVFKIVFPISGVETFFFVPPLVSFVISFFTSMSGVSGAFLLLPFQMSYMNYTNPSVSATNFLFNIVAIPSGVYRYIKERRMAWPLTLTIAAGTMPGVLIGYYIRMIYLPDPRSFKFFVGSVLLYIGFRLFHDVLKKVSLTRSKASSIDEKFSQLQQQQDSRIFAGLSSSAVVKTVSYSLLRTEYSFWGERFHFNTSLMFLLSFIIGIVGGVYGIGGGAIIAPICVTFFHLPVYTVAGATLLGTFLTSVCGIIFYSFIPVNGSTMSPDWLLGLLFGAGGFAGMYLGARCQKHVGQKYIKILLGSFIMIIAIKYILQYFG